jgi:hypothetical protein
VALFANEGGTYDDLAAHLRYKLAAGASPPGH